MNVAPGPRWTTPRLVNWLSATEIGPSAVDRERLAERHAHDVVVDLERRLAVLAGKSLLADRNRRHRRDRVRPR